MSDTISNPFSSGGGGANFETQVQAAFLTIFLCNTKPPFSNEHSIETIRFQGRQAGFRTDDLVVTLKDTSGSRSRALLQIKHGIKLVQSDKATRSTFEMAWLDFKNHADPD
ncbi:MAG: hypothetical protein AAFX39_12015 [Pseudomonadota bacterium]